MDLNEGDVFFWRWKHAVRHGDFAYHCKSMIAVVKDGQLLDTYWGDMKSDSVIDPDKVTLEFQGNLATLEQITASEARYYRACDVVDMRHANTSIEAVYRKPGTARDVDVMRALSERLIESCESEIRFARSRIEWIRRDLASIEAGDVDRVELPHIK